MGLTAVKPPKMQVLSWNVQGWTIFVVLGQLYHLSKLISQSFGSLRGVLRMGCYSGKGHTGGPQYSY